MIHIAPNGQRWMVFEDLGCAHIAPDMGLYTPAMCGLPYRDGQEDCEVGSGIRVCRKCAKEAKRRGWLAEIELKGE